MKRMIRAGTDAFDSQVEQSWYDVYSQYPEYRDDPRTVADIIIEHIEMLSEDEDYGFELNPLPKNYKKLILNKVRELM